MLDFLRKPARKTLLAFYFLTNVVSMAIAKFLLATSRNSLLVEVAFQKTGLIHYDSDRGRIPHPFSAMVGSYLCKQCGLSCVSVAFLTPNFPEEGTVYLNDFLMSHYNKFPIYRLRTEYLLRALNSSDLLQGWKVWKPFWQFKVRNIRLLRSACWQSNLSIGNVKCNSESLT